MSIEILEYVVELAIILLTETKSNDVELKGIEANLVVGTPDPLVKPSVLTSVLFFVRVQKQSVTHYQILLKFTL
jgi:hypothetical protein